MSAMDEKEENGKRKGEKKTRKKITAAPVTNQSPQPHTTLINRHKT
jgi:hypothetical protein